MKNLFKLLTLSVVVPALVISCGKDGINGIDGENGTNGIDGSNGLDGINGLNPETDYFVTASKLPLGDGVPEISAFDTATNTVFSTNAAANEVEVIDITDVTNPTLGTPIKLSDYGAGVNSVACKNGYLAIAVEANTKTDNGKVVIFETTDLTTPYAEITAGALPDMVIFTPDGKYLLSANEGEPNDKYDVDPKGSISLIDVATKTVQTIYFDAFNSQEADLEAEGFRVFGPGADLATDVEPEYIAISDDSSTAYVALQENNGIAVFDIATATITDIYPLGTKDFSDFYFDVSNEDGIIGNFKEWPVLSFYQPDAIDYFTSNGNGYIITANEGDARDYDGFSEEDRVKDLTLDATAYPDADELQEDENLGRLKTTYYPFGGEDKDAPYDQIYGYGGRSFSIWNTNGELVYDSGNQLSLITYNQFGSYPEDRSDDKGTEPEAVTTFMSGDKIFAAIGLERSGDVLIYNITDIYNPVFVQRLANTSPEGLLVVDAANSPNGKTLLIVSNESPNDATLNIYTK